MSDANTKSVKFEPPGPGAWELESTHFSRPITSFARDAVLRAFPQGFAESSERYGLLLSHFEPAIVNGFMYNQAVPFGAPKGAKGPPPKLLFKLLTRLVPKLRKRIAVSQHALEGKIWRDDLKRWDTEVKPASIRAHLALQSVELPSLSPDAFAAHLVACRDHYERMVRQHHQFTVTCALPVGDFLAHVKEWTGKAPGEILRLLKGSSEISKGVAAAELDVLAKTIRERAASRDLLSKGPPAEILATLRSSPDPVGAAARAYLDIVEHRSLGYDVSERVGRELPEMLVRAIRSSVDGVVSKTDGTPMAERVAGIRDKVPEKHRALFDELLGEARNINRLRDERGHYSDGWAAGLARRAVLEAGHRLVKSGKLDDAELAVDATCDELIALLRGGKEPTVTELRERARFRTTAKLSDAPPWLTAPPSPPPPAEWLPQNGRRSARAVDAFITALFVEPEAKTTSRSVEGLAVSPGVYEGTARLVEKEVDFGRIERGDVLVARSTSPYFNVVLPLLGAIVTDRGGQLCHAAIVSREYGIPGVVGTREATRVLQDGQRVRVDGDLGRVESLH